MSDTVLMKLGIVFKSDTGHVAHIWIDQKELDRLIHDFEQTEGRGIGVYSVLDSTDKEPRRLFLRFSDILYIG